MTKKFIIEITKEAGSKALALFGNAKVVYTKKDAADFVTKADILSNKLLVQRIRKQYPQHGIISEEQGEYNSKAEYVWIVDPLDGTRNFATGTPQFSVIVALAHKGVVTHSCVYDPYNEDLVYAERGKGTRKNGKKVFCSNSKNLLNSWGVISPRFSAGNVEKVLGPLVAFASQEQFFAGGLGSFGINAMYVADGRRDWAIHRGGSVWDHAAVSLILQEAGCMVTNFKGLPWTFTDTELVAANKRLHRTLLGLLSGKTI